MTPSEAVRFLRVSSRSQIADVTPERCAELADVFENAVSEAATASDFNERVQGALTLTEQLVRRALDRIGAINATESKAIVAVLAEREACAKLVEELGYAVTEGQWLADMIRERTVHDAIGNGGIIDYGVTNATR
jgi:hypothetical protein